MSSVFRRREREAGYANGLPARVNAGWTGKQTVAIRTVYRARINNRAQRRLGRVPDSSTSAIYRERETKSAVFALGISLMIGAVMIVVSIFLLASYGASLFLGTPLIMGASAGYIFNRGQSRGHLPSVGLGFATVLCRGVALLLFALEGLICVAMAVPLLRPLGALGGLMGKAIADSTRRPAAERGWRAGRGTNSTCSRNRLGRAGLTFSSIAYTSAYFCTSSSSRKIKRRVLERRDHALRKTAARDRRARIATDCLPRACRR